MDDSHDDTPTPLLPPPPITKQHIHTVTPPSMDPHKETETLLMALVVARSRVCRLMSFNTKQAPGETNPLEACLHHLDQAALCAGTAARNWPDKPTNK